MLLIIINVWHLCYCYLRLSIAVVAVCEHVLNDYWKLKPGYAGALW